MIHQTTCAHTPEQNGVDERKNRILLEMTRAMLIESQVPKIFWPEALATSTYLLNRLPTHILKFRTPIDTLALHTNIPQHMSLEPRVFGCSVFVHIPKHERTKLSPCAIKCVFVGYGVNQKGYRCFDPKSKRIHTTMNCDFLESEYFYTYLSGQGESNTRNNVSDPLSWVSMPSTPEANLPDEAVRSSAGQVSDVIQTEEASDTCPTISPLLISDVSPTIPINVNNESDVVDESKGEDNDHSKEVETETTIEVEGIDPDTGGYVLPPRANRGVPPKKYTPERINRKAKYSIVNMAKGHLTEMAQAFEEAIYDEEEIPQ